MSDDKDIAIEGQLVEHPTANRQLQTTGNKLLLDLPPSERIDHASQIATLLADIVIKQKLFIDISGKKHIYVEGWTTLGMLLGVGPRETSVETLDDGAYVANVDLVRFDTGAVVGGASAVCGMDEKRWKDAEHYARRSMAITRATGKAFRLTFSWIVTLAGFSPTPAEEMVDVDQLANTASSGGDRDIRTELKKEPMYTGSLSQKKMVKSKAAECGVSERKHLEGISAKLMNKPLKDMDTLISDYVSTTKA